MSKFKRKRLVRGISCKLTSILKSEEVCYLLQIFYVWKMFQRKANYGFRLPDHGACKHLWKCAIEHHTFYSNEIKPGKVRRSSSLSPQRFFKRHSKYQYSGRTQDQVIKDSLSIQRPNPEIKRTPSIRISTRQDVSKKSSETANNNRNTADTPSGDGSTSTFSGSDPLKEFETEHIPEVPPDDHNHSQIDLVDSKWTGNENGPVTEVGAVSDSETPENEGNVALSVLFILLLVALIIIPVAVVVQSNKEAIKSSSAYQSFAAWFQSVTGVNIL
ncbi:Hypothetical predicted protein [Paramuricea clavata]|uniref:Uncharacterized protein n=1 Tax=Paramuricea clavata TaxID=317549 RepID=A0A6S7IP89_PARCT|nr:Hypothetical predicted protein [Paramuricea clavata]